MTPLILHLQLPADDPGRDGQHLLVEIKTPLPQSKAVAALEGAFADAAEELRGEFDTDADLARAALDAACADLGRRPGWSLRFLACTTVQLVP